MSRKSKQSRQKKKVTTGSSQADRLFDLIGYQIFQGNYEEAVANCERLLNYLPRHAPMRADVLDQMGIAHAMLQNFPQSYAAYTEALSLAKNNLAALPQIRRTGPPAMIDVRDPFKSSKLKQTITFIKE